MVRGGGGVDCTLIESESCNESRAISTSVLPADPTFRFRPRVSPPHTSHINFTLETNWIFLTLKGDKKIKFYTMIIFIQYSM